MIVMQSTQSSPQAAQAMQCNAMQPACHWSHCLRAVLPAAAPGTMATWHQAADAPLQMDERALAASVSAATITVGDTRSISSAVEQALAAAEGTAAAGTSGAGAAGGCAGGRVATLLISHDVSWTAVDVPLELAGAVTPPQVLPCHLCWLVVLACLCSLMPSVHACMAHGKVGWVCLSARVPLAAGATRVVHRYRAADWAVSQSAAYASSMPHHS